MYTEHRSEGANTPPAWASYLRRDPIAPFKLRTDHRWRLIRKHLSAPILDAGCGRGEWVHFLNAHGYEAMGLDNSPMLIADNARAYPSTKWLHGTTQAMPLPDNSLGGVVSWGVIEHDPNGPQAALREFHRVLKPGGTTIVTVPYDSPAQRRASQVQFPKGTEFFQFFFTPDELASDLRRAGFEVIDAGFGPCGYPVIWPETYAKGVGWLKRRILSAAALAYPRRRYGGMIYCIGRKPAAAHSVS